MDLINKILENDIIKVRMVEKKDARSYYKFLSDNEVTKYLSFNKYRWMFQVSNTITNMIRAFYANTDIHFSIIYKKENNIIGSISLTINDNNTAEIGIIIHHDYWNKKIGKNALNLIENYAFNDLSLDKLIARYIKDNVNSGYLFSSCGYKINNNIHKTFLKNNIIYDLIYVYKSRTDL